MCLKMLDRRILECRLAFEEEIVPDRTATNGTRSGARWHPNVNELLHGSSNGFNVFLVITSLGRLALSQRRAPNVIHDDISTISPRKAQVNVRDAYGARGVRVHDSRYVRLCEAFPSEGTVSAMSVLDPKSRLAVFVDDGVVSVVSSFSAREDDLVEGGQKVRRDAC